MTKLKQRAIFTNDAECDDMNSFLHLLLYANDVDIEGLVLSSSCFHYEGVPERGIEPKRWAGGQWMWDYLDDYEKVWPNLAAQDPDFPTADALRAVTCIGNVRFEGDMEEDTDGSELIRRAIFSDDPRPIWLLAGGGTNTIARALKHVEEEYRGTPQWDEIYRRVCEKSRIFMIVTQDNTYETYIAGAWPDLPMLHCTSILGLAFIFNAKVCPPDALHVFKADWVKPHIVDQGPLCAHYHTWFDGHVYPGEQDQSQFGSNRELADGNWWGKEVMHQYDMISEGDSPSFLHLIDKGLRQLEDPTWGGWGGRFARNPANKFNPQADYYENALDEDFGETGGNAYQLTRWIHDWMNDFASRAAWCCAPTYDEANHAPEVTVAQGQDLTAAAGERLVLDAVGTDPDGDELAYEWFDYPEASTYGQHVELAGRGARAEVTVPVDAQPGQTIHVIVRVRDDADGRETYMVGYRRVVITVR